MKSLGLFILAVFFAMPQHLEARANRNNIRTLTKASDEWRKTYKFDKNIFQSMQDQLAEIVAIDRVLDFDSIDNAVKAHLQKHREGALKKIADMDSKVVPYLIREFANNVAELEKDHSGLDREAKKLVKTGILARQEAIEVSLARVGLSAIPYLTKFQTITVKTQARLLSDRTQKMISAIINHTKLEQEKAEFQKMVDSEKTEGVASEGQMPEPEAEPPLPLPTTERLGGTEPLPGQALE